MIAHIVGVNVPYDKRVVVSPTYIYGIGNTIAKKVLANIGISEDVRVCDLISEQIDAIRTGIDKLKVEGDLHRGVSLGIRCLMEISSYHEIRHRRGLLTRGQNMKNNAHTHKGPTRTVAGKRK